MNQEQRIASLEKDVSMLKNELAAVYEMLIEAGFFTDEVLVDEEQVEYIEKTEAIDAIRAFI